jgi:membrane-associated phospholipid phosphatase
LKNLAPFIVRKVFDPFIDKFERGAFRGELLSQIVRDYFGADYSDIFSDGYFLFYPFVSLLIYIFLFQPNPRIRAEFLFAFTMTWIVGALLVLAIPTLGPCFSAELNILPYELPPTGVSRMQLEIWNLRNKLLTTGTGLNLISGFPSLHVAVVTLGALYLRRISIIISLLAWIFCCITIITTLYFGWHYAVDDIGGILLAVFASRYARFKYAQYTVVN